MTVKEIVDTLPNGHPFRLETDVYKYYSTWRILLIKGERDEEYDKLLQEYGDCLVTKIEALDNGNLYDYATLWLTIKSEDEGE